MNLEVTSVSRQPEKLLETASAIQVVTSEDIRRSGASSLPEALRLADNLDVAQKNSHDWGISARGFNTELVNKLLVMIDGRTVYTPLFSGVFWNTQNYLLEDLDRIEVVSGPGGTLWGANAVNGVINIISKNARDTQGLYVEAGGGTTLHGFAGVRYGGTLAPGVHYRVYGNYFERDNEALTSGADGHDAWRRGQGGFRLDAETSGQNTFTLQGDAYSGHDELQAGGEDSNRGANILGRWSHVFSPDSDLRLQIYYDRIRFTEPVPALMIGALVLAPAGTFSDDLETWDVDFQHRFRLGERQQIVWGFGYRFTDDTVTNAPALGFLPPQLEQELGSVFAQDEIRIATNVSLTVGTKVEKNDYTGTEFDPSARLQWHPDSDRTLWAAVSRAVRRPSRIDRDLSQGVPPYFVLLKGGPEFDSETVVAYELGYRTRLGSSASASVSAFYNVYDDIRSTSANPTTLFPLFFENNLEGENYGVELSGTYQISPQWRLHAGYTLLQEDIRIKPGKSDLNNALNETSDPEHRVSVRSSVDLPGNVEFDAGLRWVDTRPTHNGSTPGTVPSYVELETRLGWRPTETLECSIVGQNLLHDQHPEYGFPSPTRGEIQRSIYGKISWRY